MKFNINTYEDFLKLSAIQVRIISEEDFDLYTDAELSNIDKFSSQYMYDLNNKNISHTIIIENKYDNILNKNLSAEDLLKLPAYLVLEYFRRHPNE